MAGLHVYRSNRLELLADALAEIARQPLRSVFERELIVVQSLGMRRWLSLEIAQRHGVVMNLEFPFPATFVQDVFAAAFPELPADSLQERDWLRWRILRLLPQFARAPGFEELDHYLSGEMRALKEYQLASRIASAFDRYLAYRPELILGWERGKDTHWQATLWRALSSGRKRSHAPALAERLRHGLQAGAIDLNVLPPRVSIFGVSSLPPFYIELFGAVAAQLDVHLFQLDPTPEYWGDIVSEKEEDRIVRRHRTRALTAGDLHLERGNPLLASMGKTGREFSQLLQALEPTSENELFADPGAGSMLHQLQADIYRLEEPELRHAARSDDSSIQIHSCHSPMRELEVLHDQLLALFEQNRDLAPRDVIVTMPDVEKYAPFIEAVFGAPESRDVNLPFHIADRAVRAESCLADTFLELLELTTTRLPTAAVLALLEARPVRRRFEFAEPEIDIIRTWIERTAIRWGMDGAHRAGFDLPPFEDNTWRAGLRRLLLGYALPGDNETLFDGVLPLREIEGSATSVLGRFVDFAEELFAVVGDLPRARSLREWERTLRHVLTTFFDENDESADEIRQLRGVFEAMGRTEDETSFEAPVSLEVVRVHLTERLADSGSGAGFLNGRLTFCALKPMRSIPFKVLCMIGMNDTAFPRHEAALGFDLIAQQPRRGDRSLREDDRQLFLESILSARDTLYISYTGLSAKDNSVAPPSVLVSALVDHLSAHFEVCGEKLSKELLVTQHRLQPFHASYFQKGSSFFSYSLENARAARQATVIPGPRAGFASERLPAPDAEWHTLQWEQLATFLSNPAKFFARERLGLRMPDECAPLRESEPQEVDPLERYTFGQRLTARALSGGDPNDQLPAIRASGQLPPGYSGDAELNVMSRDATKLAAAIAPHISGPPLAPVSVDYTDGAFRIGGVLHQVYPGAVLRYRSATIKPKDLLRAWIAHLVLQVSAGDAAPRRTLLFGKDALVEFRPIDNGPELLHDLLALYEEGLQTPLPFFPETSLEFARRTLEPLSRKSDPRAAALKKWKGGDRYGAEESRGRGEREDEWLQLCFGDVMNPLDAHSEELALRVFGPLFAARTETKL